MKKIGIILTLTLVFVIVAIFWLKHANQLDEPSAKNKQSETPVEVLDGDSTNPRPIEDTHKEEQGETSENKIVTIIAEAVQSTIDFFTNKETNIVALGDSLTQGIGDSTNQGGYVGILDRTINENNQLVHFDNYGKQGDRTDQLLNRMDIPEISASIQEADIVLITIGANDIMQVVKENFTNLTYNKFAKERINYEKRLRAIFNKIRGLNETAEIYLIGFYNPFAKYFPDIEELGLIVDDWNQTGIKVTEAYEQITYIPLQDVFADTDVDLFYSDNFHPNDIGYQRMAKRVLEYLTDHER